VTSSFAIASSVTGTAASVTPAAGRRNGFF
jgi:hypothetical protein